MGLQHRGQSAWCSGRDCYSNFHHDLGPRATHPAKVKLPGDTWQKELKHRTLQGNTEVSKVMQGQGKMEQKEKYTHMIMRKLNMWMQDTFLHSPTVKVSQEHSWEEWNIVVTVGRPLFIKAPRKTTSHKCCEPTCCPKHNKVFQPIKGRIRVLHQLHFKLVKIRYILLSHCWYYV